MKREILSLAVLSLLITTCNSTQDNDFAKIYGVGYFQKEGNDGIDHASIAGGTEIMITGSKFNADADSNLIKFYSSDFGDSFDGTSLSHDNHFRSQAGNSKLQYTLPPLTDLIGVSLETIADLGGWLGFTLWLQNNEGLGRLANLNCRDPADCQISYSSSYTPLLYQVKPPIAFYNQITQFIVDPKSCPDLQDEADTLPFNYAKIGSSVIDFEDFYDSESTLGTWYKQYIKGRVGEIEPALDNTPSIHFDCGRALLQDTTLTTCNYDESDCYVTRSLPSIDWVSHNAGYSSGGQLLVISGHGFNSDDISISIDGTNCAVQSVSEELVTCETEASGAATTPGNFIGQQGLREIIYDGGVGSTVDYEQISIESETLMNLASYYGREYKGYFKAPATTNYKFYIACTASCTFYLSSDSDPANKETHTVTGSGYNGFRDYYSSSQYTGWISLTADNYYYLEVSHYSGSQSHVSVAVEIEKSSGTHNNAKKEIQRLQINPVIDFEQTEIHFEDSNGLDGLDFNIYFTHDDGTEHGPYTVSSHATDSEFRSAVHDYFDDENNADISVSVEMYDNGGSLTSDPALSVNSVYTITYLRATSTPTSSAARVSSAGTAGTGYGVPPSGVQLSSDPLRGSFVIDCVNIDGTPGTTSDIGYNAWAGTILNRINSACPSLMNRFTVWNGNSHRYYDNGRDLFIQFDGINQDMGQFSIRSSTNDPLSGGSSIPTSSTTVNDLSTNIMYTPIPYDYLYSYHEVPELQMTVGGQSVVCPYMNCNFEFEDALSSISGFTYSGSTLTIDGSALDTDDFVVYFGQVPCEVSASSADQITCDTSEAVVAGLELFPHVKTELGLVPIDNGVAGHPQGLTVSSISPNTGLNLYGGSVLTISGSNFPHSLDLTHNTIEVAFSDGTSCQVLSSASDEITCRVIAFDSSSIGNSLTVTVTVNGQSDSSQSVGVSSVTAQIDSITPTNYSPVLKTDLEIVISSTFTGSFTRDDFTVTLVPQAADGQSFELNVYKADSSTNTLTVRYGGAYSGVYDVHVVSASFGDINSNGATFEAVGTVTNLSPTSGSANGGTVLTITGYTFSDEPSDNPVMIGGHYCDVFESSETTIKCRTPKRAIVDAVTDDVLVFLKTSEEAVWTVANTFDWVVTGAEVTAFTAAYDSGSDSIQLTFTGVNFDGTSSDIEVYVDGYLQTVDSASSTEIVATLVNANDLSADVSLYLPSGAAEETVDLSYSLNPYFTSVFPTVGSPAGSILYMTVHGVGALTEDIQFLTGSGDDLCKEVAVESYGVVSCTTNELDLSSGTTLSISVAGSTYSCEGTCDYTTDASLPSVSAVSASVDKVTVTFTGANFLDSGYSATAYFKGVPSSSATIDSTSQVTATFDNGLPLSDADEVPQLLFQSDSTTEAHYAQNTHTLNNVVSISGSTSSSLSCSFAGGCSITVNLDGLSSSVANDAASLTVCGEPAIYDATNSNSASAVFKAPAISTVHSIQEYDIQESHVLAGTLFSSNPDGQYVLTDKENQIPFEHTADCHFGMSFRSGYVGILSEVKIFMTEFEKDLVDNNLVFQASHTGLDSDYTTLFTVDEEVHEGWNKWTYEGDDVLKYRYYRFVGSEEGACNVGEFELVGVEAMDSSSSSESCPILLNLDGTSHDLDASVDYEDGLTPSLDSISPRFGTVEGGTQVTFTGSGFSSNAGDISIKIDDKTCNIDSASATEVVCTTTARPGLHPETTLEFTISGFGSVATRGLVFRYVNLWSSSTTWGGEDPPAGGDTVWIPEGMHLLMDLDSTPVLNLVLVEGSLIFAPDSDPAHLRTFDTTYIFISGGYLEVGTEEHPYTSRLIITMHGDKHTTEIPIYGVKVTAVRNGVLELHGEPRSPTWTELAETVLPGEDVIVLNTAVDWKVDEEIVIAPTSYENYEAEVRKIAAIDRSDVNSPIITLNETLLYKHYSGSEEYGKHTLTMRAEVGLLTRNVMYRGDPETSGKNRFGGHIMLHSHGDESLIGRIEYCEFMDVGQAFQLGRYPIHFHLIGQVTKSYIRGNSIHHTYNRAVTIHDVEYLSVIDNVAYNTMGHTFFIEDAVETKNYLDHNLAILTKRSWSLLNTDQTPASFWITHPDNIFRNNHAAGSDRYGFWFDLQVHSTGPSFSPNVCPINSKLGEFEDNVAHSNGRYGLRIFHGMVPRQFPCSPIRHDPVNNPSSQYSENPLITAKFKRFLGYKNKINGAIAERVGDVRFQDFQVADNLVGGIEFSLTGEVGDSKAQVKRALIVGRSANDEGLIESGIRYGLITPRTENFTVTDVDFFNFHETNDAAIGSCSHCFHPASTDSGARTVRFKKLEFTNVAQKIVYQMPYRAIFSDLDGSLTGIGKDTWATPYWRHNEQPECQISDEHDGLLCDDTVQVRRIAFDAYTPDNFYGQEMKIMQHDDYILQDMLVSDYNALKLDLTQYSEAIFRKQVDPKEGWAMPFVTNHRYKIHWGTGLDFESMRFTMSNRWENNDHPVYLDFNHSDVREAVNFFYQNDAANAIENNTLADNQVRSGNNYVDNTTAVRLISTVASGRDHSRNPITMEGIRCIDVCVPVVEDVVVEDLPRYWSDPTSWTSGAVPVAGEDVEIESGWNMILDIDTPILNHVEVNGRLTFQDDSDLHFQAYTLFVRAGELLIGSEREPHVHKATITLHGSHEDQYIVFASNIEAGDKMIVNTGRVEMHGTARSSEVVRLLNTAKPGSKSLELPAGLDWVAGDKIGLAPTALNHNDTDYVEIDTYDEVTGYATIVEELTGLHWGASESTASDYEGVDMRGEVFLLTRNVKVEGEDTDAWGCQFLTSEFEEENGVLRAGKTVLNNVEFYNCSQYDTMKAAVRFEAATYAQDSSIRNSVFHHGNGIGLNIEQSANIFMDSNIFFDFVRFSALIQTSTNITVQNSAFIGVTARTFTGQSLNDLQAVFVACAYITNDICTDLTILNNIAAGGHFYGFVLPGHSCGSTNPNIMGNVGHSISGQGITVYPDPAADDHGDCYVADNFAAYKNQEAGYYSYYRTKELRVQNAVVIDNVYGFIAQIGRGDDVPYKVLIEDSHIFGETESPDCIEEDQCNQMSAWDFADAVYCQDKHGSMLPYITHSGKDIFPKSASALPVYKPKSNSQFFGSSEYRNVQFHNYPTKETFCGREQNIFVANPKGADIHHPVEVQSSIFFDVAEEAIAYLFSPPINWAVIDDCGSFPCTGPEQVLINFKSTQFFGTASPNYPSDFQISANNPNFSPNADDCDFVEEWNGYFCENSNLGVLLFESLDDDREKRSYSPVTLYNLDKQQTSILNQFMDHIWDGFYTGQLRLNRFATLIEGDYDYELLYTGTVPGKQRFHWAGENGGSIIRIHYLKTGSFKITDEDGDVIAPNEFDDSLGEVRPLSKSRCGENRFVGLDNYLEFYINRGCTLIIEPKDSIMTRIRMDWTMDEFYADGGATKFVDRLTGALGVHAADVHIASVYEGSVIAEIVYDNSATSQRNRFKRVLRKNIENEKLDVGATILNAEFDDGEDIEVIIIGDEDTDEQTDTTTTSSSSATQTSSSSTNSTSVQVGNSTIVISSQNTNETTSEEEDKETDTPAIVDESFLDTTKIIIICVVLTIILVALVVLAVCLYKRNKQLHKETTTYTTQKQNESPDRRIENSEKKTKKLQQKSSSLEEKDGSDQVDVVISDVDVDEQAQAYYRGSRKSISAVAQWNAMQDKSEVNIFNTNQSHLPLNDTVSVSKMNNFKDTQNVLQSVKSAKVHPERSSDVQSRLSDNTLIKTRKALNAYDDRATGTALNQGEPLD